MHRSKVSLCSAAPSMLYALSAFVIYGLIGWFVKNLYPFSAYSMYAPVAKMRDSHVPVFFADGEEADIADFVCFHGFGAHEMWPRPRTCTLMWMIHEARRWVEEHRSQEECPDSVPVEWGVWRVTIEPDGTVQRELEILCRGRARRR